MKKKLTLLFLAISQSTHASLIVDSFNDASIDTNIWSVFSSTGGQIAEGSGNLNYILEMNSHAGIRLNESISSDFDFSLNVDISFQHESISQLAILGIVVYEVNLEGSRESAAAFSTNNTNSIGITDFDPYTFVSGASIGDTSFTFQIDYSQNNESFTFSSLTEGGIVDTLTLSVRGDSNHDLTSEWELQEGAAFGIEIVAEAFSAPVSPGLIELENFALSAVPEPRNFALYIGLVVILYHKTKRNS
ncbi:MAG: hypothetical protein AAGH40_14555 [Verrucomicrobiota bacterium]